MKPASRYTLRLIFVLIFLSFWVLMMVSAMAAGGCRKETISEVRRLRLCNVALFVPTMPGDGHKRAQIYLERGIVHARLGNPERARADMSRAAQDARAPAFRDALTRRLSQEPRESAARDIWAEVAR